MREEGLSRFVGRFAELDPIGVLVGAICIVLVLGSGLVGTLLGRTGLAVSMFAGALATAALGFIIMTVQSAKEPRNVRRN